MSNVLLEFLAGKPWYINAQGDQSELTASDLYFDDAKQDRKIKGTMFGLLLLMVQATNPNLFEEAENIVLDTALKDLEQYSFEGKDRPDAKILTSLRDVFSRVAEGHYRRLAAEERRLEGEANWHKQTKMHDYEQSIVYDKISDFLEKFYPDIAVDKDGQLRGLYRSRLENFSRIRKDYKDKGAQDIDTLIRRSQRIFGPPQGLMITAATQSQYDRKARTAEICCQILCCLVA